MSHNNKIFKTGEKYEVKYFFSGENDKINIPDLQRDYCWGGQDRLIENFTESLLEFCGIIDSEQWSAPAVEADVPMGLIYGYFDKNIPYHLQLCDGQQRLTTIFLILGVLNQMDASAEIGELLMSNFEKNLDDHEPYLRYGIRESSLYFLSDLTYHVFLGKEKDPSILTKIKEQPWYIHEYDFDPTIISIIQAVESIFNTLQSYNLKAEQLHRFASKISEVKFLYYDMGDRESGEKTFVVINTTGEPLSPTQNLKPIIINKCAPISRRDEATMLLRKTISAQWEEMESWFWENRKISEETADNGMSAFFHALWFFKSPDQKTAFQRYEWQSNLNIKDIKDIPFDEIYSCFKSYRRLYPLLMDIRNNQSPSLSAAQLFYTAPLLKYLEKFPMVSDRELLREFQIFRNMVRYRYIDRDGTYMTAPAFLAMNIVESQPSADTFSLINHGFERNENYMVEERTKLEFVLENSRNSESSASVEDLRNEIEDILWRAQELEIFNGEIKEIVADSGDVKSFRETVEKYKALFDDKLVDLDILRRALLADNFVPTGMDNFWGPIEDRRKLARQPEFIDWIRNLDFSDVPALLEDIIASYKEESDPFYLIIKEGWVLNFSVSKKFYKFKNGLIDLYKKRSNNTFHLFIYKSNALNQDLGLPNIGRIHVRYPDGEYLWTDLPGFNFWAECNLIDNAIIYHTDYYPDRKTLSQENLDRINLYIQDNPVNQEDPIASFRDFLYFLNEYMQQVSEAIIPAG